MTRMLRAARRFGLALALLPAIARIRDADHGEPLRALLEVPGGSELPGMLLVSRANPVPFPGAESLPCLKRPFTTPALLKFLRESIDVAPPPRPVYVPPPRPARVVVVAPRPRPQRVVVVRVAAVQGARHSLQHGHLLQQAGHFVQRAAAHGRAAAGDHDLEGARRRRRALGGGEPRNMR